MTVPGNEGVAGRIKLSQGAIGYVEYGIAQRGDLAMAWLENKAGAFIQPHGGSGLATLLNVRMPDNLRVFEPDPDGEDSYPIVTYSWLLLYKTYDKPAEECCPQRLCHMVPHRRPGLQRIPRVRPSAAAGGLPRGARRGQPPLTCEEQVISRSVRVSSSRPSIAVANLIGRIHYGHSVSSISFPKTSFLGLVCF